MNTTIYEKLEKYNKAIENKKIILSSSENVFNYIKTQFQGLNKEIVFFIGMDTKNQVRYKKLIFQGGLNYSIVETRQIIKECLINDLSGFFLIHNHPSGVVTPSEEDINITQRLKKASDLMNIRFLDHLILNYEENVYYSLFDNDKF
ncbi:hypothetical protein EOM09_08300 [bacterium]|nr:hypothetical protein [bacterium]